ncbi:MAG TPA: hypothetical protein VJ860_05125, partial [Polyangia bacterium]|nr:hypothetical protein [Polyangia bacterium]
SLPAPPLAAPTVRDARPASVSSQAPIPRPAAKPSVAQLAAKPTAALAPKAVAAPPPRDSATSSPPSSSPAPLPAAAPAAPVQPTTPSLAEPPSDRAASAAAGQQPGTGSRPSKPSESPTPSAIRGASTAAANLAPSALNHISGEIRHSSTSLRGTEERPSGVELAEDMQDPAAFVATPPPVQAAIMSSLAQTTPTPISPAPQPAGRPDDEFAALDAGPSEDLSVDIEAPRSRPGKRRAQQEPTGWPWLVHVLIGVVLGAAVVVAYSAYYGLPLP